VFKKFKPPLNLYNIPCILGNAAHFYCNNVEFYFFLWGCGPTRSMAASFLRFLDHTQRQTTVVRAPLDVWSARRRDLYLATNNTQFTTDKHPCPRRETNQQSQRASSHSPTPFTARPLGPADNVEHVYKIYFAFRMWFH